jgi:Delta3,5-Delta2,4-dienoyl-CoA isomerase
MCARHQVNVNITVKMCAGYEVDNGVDTCDRRQFDVGVVICARQEVDIGIVADVGTLQRLPKIVGNDSLVRELCYTARQLKSAEALSVGLVR